MAERSRIIPGIGEVSRQSGLRFEQECSDGVHRVGANGVESITTTGDGKVEFIAFRSHTLAYVKSAMGHPAYYPVREVELRRPIKGVLMDLDGTTVRSEHFWVWMIELATASLIDDRNFHLQPEDMPFVAGHSVSEHLLYTIKKYAPGRSIEEARKYYFEHTHRELQKIEEGSGRLDAFTPSPGVKQFLIELKQRGVKIGLVTSGLYEKAWPAILSVFRTLDLGDPREFYDAIITAGFPLRKGEIGTLGELAPKPHPWLYAETAVVGLGLPVEDRHSIVCIEDSGAGVCAARIAGFPTLAIAGGNVVESGTSGLCQGYCEDFKEISAIIG